MAAAVGRKSVPSRPLGIFASGQTFNGISGPQQEAVRQLRGLQAVVVPMSAQRGADRLRLDAQAGGQGFGSKRVLVHVITLLNAAQCGGGDDNLFTGWGVNKARIVLGPAQNATIIIGPSRPLSSLMASVLAFSILAVQRMCP